MFSGGIKVTDDYGFTDARGQEIFSGMYLEKVGETRHRISFQKIKKTMFFYKTSGIYPFVKFEKIKT